MKIAFVILKSSRKCEYIKENKLKEDIDSKNLDEELKKSEKANSKTDEKSNENITQNVEKENSVKDNKQNTKNIEKKSKNKPKKQSAWVWPVKVLVIALVLSFSFSVISELTLSNANIVLAVIVILVFIGIAVLTDMIGLAVTTSNLETFTAMASRKVKGSKQAIALVKNADRVSSICSDVLGDVCGILSGSAGASILAKVVMESAGDFTVVLISSVVSAVIAGLTIFGKAALKRYAISHADGITLTLAKFLNIFTRRDKKD